MAEHSSIEWTRSADGTPGATWNPITGCSVVSPGCTHCYAMRLAGTRLQHHPSRAGLTRMAKGGPVWTGEVRLNVEWIEQPLRWKRPRMIFVCAHGDLFHEKVPIGWLDEIFSVMQRAEQHTFQVLTKRPEVMADYLAHEPVLKNVWIGFSAEDQLRFDERSRRVRALAKAGWLTWCSAEPLLGPIDIQNAPWLRWLVAGGESGPGARAMHADWARSLRDQCAAADVPFFFKQWGEWAPGESCDGLVVRTEQTADWVNKRWFFGTMTPRESEDLHIDDEPDLYCVGKKRAGRLLDGVTHDGMPA